jgi:ABC-type nitrate/sulfonate/bicarbonate transport system permease component
MVVSAVIGMLFFAVVAAGERIALPWHDAQRDPSPTA